MKISREKLADGATATEFSLSDGAKGWCTPILKLPKPLTVTAFTALRFKVKADVSRSYEINLDTANGPQYAARFRTVAGEWHENEVVLKDAPYKRGGKSDRIQEGLLGLTLTGIQLAYSGNRIIVKDLKIVELDPDRLHKAREVPQYMADYLKNKKHSDFPVFKRNAVFPFGVISTVGAGDKVNGEYFGQTAGERFEDDLRDIRRRGFNTFSNFVERSGFSMGERLELMKKYHLYLLETQTCSTAISQLPEGAPLLSDVKKYTNHPNLLAWYGQDEPTDEELYLKNKARIEEIANGTVPFTSAMHMMVVVQSLGPAMDVVMIDPYSLGPNVSPQNAENVLNSHSLKVKKAYEFCRGKQVWMIPQALGMRNRNQRTLRYPSPAEARYDVFNSLAAGANGFIFFIYNDTVPYLDGKLRGEEFDQTMVDAWGNGNPTTDAWSETAQRLTAVMPSFLERKPAGHERKIGLPESWKAAQWQTEDGILLIIVNRDLLHERRGRIAVQLEPGEKLYDLDRTQSIPAVSELKLQPGDGALFLIARPEKWDRVKNEISARREQHAREIASLQEDFPPELLEIRKLFGHINAMLVAPEAIQRVDAKPEWNDFRERMKASSKAYFTARREWRHDKQIKVDLGRLHDDIKELLDEAKARIAAK